MNTIVCTVSRIGYSTISGPHQITVNINIVVLTSKLTGKTAVKSPDILTSTILGTSLCGTLEIVIMEPYFCFFSNFSYIAEEAPPPDLKDTEYTFLQAFPNVPSDQSKPAADTKFPVAVISITRSATTHRTCFISFFMLLHTLPIQRSLLPLRFPPAVRSGKG